MKGGCAIHVWVGGKGGTLPSTTHSPQLASAPQNRTSAELVTAFTQLRSPRMIYNCCTYLTDVSAPFPISHFSLRARMVPEQLQRTHLPDRRLIYLQETRQV